MKHYEILAIFIILLISKLTAAQATTSLQMVNPTLSSWISLDIGLSLVRKLDSLFRICSLRGGSPSYPVIAFVPHLSSP